jgi:hypothetical protein
MKQKNKPSYVYEFFLRFVVSSEVGSQVAERYIDPNFIINVLELFDSEGKILQIDIYINNFYCSISHYSLLEGY